MAWIRILQLAVSSMYTIYHTLPRLSTKIEKTLDRAGSVGYVVGDGDETDHSYWCETARQPRPGSVVQHALCRTGGRIEER